MPTAASSARSRFRTRPTSSPSPPRAASGSSRSATWSRDGAPARGRRWSSAAASPRSGGWRRRAMAATYTAKDILVLEGLEPVRRRPGMYIGGVDAAGLHHLLWEIVDNSVDEAMNGHADKIRVTLHEDGESCTVVDNGRGIPIDKHTQ